MTESVSASAFPLFINTGTDALPAWKQVLGLDTVTPQPSVTMDDDGKLENAGWDEKVPTSRGLTYSCSGKAQYDSAGAKDPGQAAVEVLGKGLGAASIGRFRIDMPGTKSLSFSAKVGEVVAFTSADKGLSKWSANLVVEAPGPVEITKPA